MRSVYVDFFNLIKINIEILIVKIIFLSALHEGVAIIKEKKERIKDLVLIRLVVFHKYDLFLHHMQKGEAKSYNIVFLSSI